MEVDLSPDLEGKLARAAGRRGVSADVLIREAIERAVDYDDWFIREVEKGLAQIDGGDELPWPLATARTRIAWFNPECTEIPLSLALPLKSRGAKPALSRRCA